MAALLILAVVLCGCHATPEARANVPAPLTKPEQTQHQETSRLDDVLAFLAALEQQPFASRLQRVPFGKSHEGRELPMVRAAMPQIDETKALRALVISNIHAGEVEGKEAVQSLLREIALGQHADLLQNCVLYFVPVYNADGNERMSRKNRPEQNGPDSVGERPNAQGLDLNRDFVKAEAPETRALLAAMSRIDPHLFFDLHTTDGSWHGYDLTYAPSLATNCDARVAAATRTILDAAKASLLLLTPPLRTFDYGNFETKDWDGGGAPSSTDGIRAWWTYDHRARYCVNGFGLRNRIGILSEAYSNANFENRIAATRAFVLACLRSAAQDRDAIVATLRAADELLMAGSERVSFGFDTTFAAPTNETLLLQDCERIALPDGLGVRFSRRGEVRQETMPVFRAFTSRQHIELPQAWAIERPSQPVLDALSAHGIHVEILTEPKTATVSEFAVRGKRKPKRPFQGHQELQLTGDHGQPDARQLPVGTAWVDARQARARLAATLLEPQSEDSLSTWNFFEAQTDRAYPVLRVLTR